MNDREILAEGRHLRLVREDGWEHAERVGVTGVVVVIALVEQKLILTEQYRRPVGHRVIELPAGLAGDGPAQQTEALSEAARRELLEETGYEADQMTYLMHGPPSAGMSNEVLTFFRAEGCRRVAQGGGEGSEDIRVHVVPLDGVEAWLKQKAADGVLIDPKVFAGLHFAQAGRTP